MDRRVKERRRSVRRERGRRRAGIVIASAAVLVALAVFVWLRSSDVFAVERVTATRVEHVTSEQIASATALSRGESLLALSVRPIEDALAEFPYVHSARVLRRFPNTLEVQVVEHVAVARVQIDNGTWLVSDDGRLLEKSNGVGSGAPLPLPLFVPEGQLTPKAGEYMPAWLAKALPLASLLADTDDDLALPGVRSVRVALTGEVVADLEGGAELRLGEPSQLKQKLTVAATILEQYLRDGHTVAYVDVSVPDRVAVKAD